MAENVVNTNNSMKPVYWLAVGMFAIGTESFMIVPLLPRMSADLSVSLVEVGMLVTVFTLTLALSSPILTTLLGNLNRRKLLIIALAAFDVANGFAWASSNYWQLLTARILLALSAGLYTPNANALAGSIVPPAQRGRAISIVNTGLTFAVAFGLPLGSLIGQTFGWRMTFLGVGLISLLAIIGLLVGIHSKAGDHMKVASLGDRLQVAGQPNILIALLITLMWAAGAYVLWTYFAPYLTQTIGAGGQEISAVVFLWGISAATGVILGGHLSDRFGHRAVMVPLLSLLLLTLLTFSGSALFLTQREAIVPVGISVFLWGIAGWGFYPAQLSRLVGLAGHAHAPVALSLNTSSMYLGFSIGASVGSLVMLHGSVADLGWPGAIFEVVALLLLLSATRGETRSMIVQNP